MLRMTLAAAVVAVSAFAVPAFAAPLAPQSSIAETMADSGLTQQVHYRYRHRHYHYWGGGHRRCGFWRHECAARWGWGPGYRRCLWRHGC